MKPNDAFYYLKNNQISPDMTSLTQLYLPIMGADAYQIYQYLVHFFDNGKALHPFTEVLNHVQFGFERLCASLDVLGALGLIQFYQLEQTYLIKLNSPLDREAFLANGVLRSLLAQRIGTFATEQLMLSLPDQHTEITKRFSDVFTDKGEYYFRPSQAVADFRIDHFKDRLMREGKIRFADERFDIIGLYSLSDTYKKTWYDLYQLAKETAVTTVDKNGLPVSVLSIDRLRVKLEALKDSPKVDLEQAERSLVQVAKRYKPLEFLEFYKADKKGVVTDKEKKFITALSERGLLDEVINILLFYTLQRTQKGNVEREYLNAVLNDFLFKDIKTAEQAVAHFSGQKPKYLKENKLPHTNVPSWSNPNYKEDITEEEQAELDRQMKELLDQLDGEN